MDKFISFTRFTPYGADHTVMADKIESWHSINEGGSRGTCIVMLSGASIKVGNDYTEVSIMVRNAQSHMLLEG